MNKKEVQKILKQLNARPQKKFGQNFLIDNNFLNKILNVANISKDEIILEVGAGLGALTEKIAEKARKVYAIEIDPKLISYLKKKFSNFENVELREGDILKVDVPFHHKVVSNIPYSITGPLLETLFFKKNPPPGILTIEKTIADRIFFQEDNKKISRIAIGVNSFMKPIARFNVPQSSFFPPPRIEPSLINIKPKDNIDPFLLERDTREYFLKFVAGIMPYKNKNIGNALELFMRNNNRPILKKEQILKFLKENNYENNKVLVFDVDDFLKICKLLYDLN